MYKNINKILSFAGIISVLMLPTSTLALSQDETVYTKISNNTTNTIISEHLINDKKDNNISVATNLDKITNTNGDENYTMNNGIITWESDGNDIYYQGTNDNVLPIKTDITYSLDGAIMNQKDMIGKSGKVIITIKYTNLCKHIINGNTLYTPFLVTLGTSISVKDNTNVKVSNGKVTSTGTSNLVAAISTPGLYESLNIDGLKSLDTITITYDTTNFSSSSIYMVATPKLVDTKDLDIFTKLDGVYTKVNTLSNSSRALVSGSKTLLTGINTYNDNFNQFLTGINKVRDYTNVFNTNLDDISKGSSDINNGLSDLNNGTNSLVTGVTKLSDGITNAKSGSNSLNSNIQSITAGVSTSASNLVGAINNTTDNDAKASMITQLLTIEKTFGVDSTLVSKGLNLDASNATTTGYNVLLQTIQSLSDGSNNLNDGINSLDNAINNKDTGLLVSSKKIAYAVDQLKIGSDKLNSGINTFKDGFNTYTISVNTLASSADKLNNGAKEIGVGANSLYEGLSKFDNEGIQALASLVNGNIKNTENRIRSLVNLSNQYNSFSKSDIDGTTKFITIIEN